MHHQPMADEPPHTTAAGAWAPGITAAPKHLAGPPGAGETQTGGAPYRAIGRGLRRVRAYTGRVMEMRYQPTAQDRPNRVVRLSDGRLVADDEVFDGFREFSARWPLYSLEETARLTVVDAPPMLGHFSLLVDWSELHEAMAHVDMFRRRDVPDGVAVPGYRADFSLRRRRTSQCDAFGGSYVAGEWQSLRGLARLLPAVDSIGHDTWYIVHSARDYENAVARARYGCRLARAVSHARAILYRIGVGGDPSSTICGTGPGYGLTGLRWVAGERYDASCTTAEVDAFVDHGFLPEVAS